VTYLVTLLKLAKFSITECMAGLEIKVMQPMPGLEKSLLDYITAGM